MGFAMRMNFVDVVVDDSLKNVKVNGKNIGYQFDIRLSYYRGHFLSVIDEFGIKVDGKGVPAKYGHPLYEVPEENNQPRTCQ